MKEKTRTDVRVERTKHAIRAAFLKLLSDKPYEAMTVKEIAIAACVDRKTVYNYYGGVYDIRADVERELVYQLEKDAIALDFKNNINTPQRIFSTLASIVMSRLEIYEYIIKIGESSSIVQKIISVIQSKLCAALSLARVDGDCEMLSRFVISGMISVCEGWMCSGRGKPLESVLCEAGKLVVGGLEEFTRERQSSKERSE